MKLKVGSKIYLIVIVFSWLIICLLFFTYKKYEKHNLEEINTLVNEEIKFYDMQMKNAFYRLSSSFTDRNIIFNKIHKRALEIIQSRDDIYLNTLKNQLINEFGLRKHGIDMDFDISLVNKKYMVFDTTFDKEINLNVSNFNKIKKLLDKAKIDDRIHFYNNPVSNLREGKYIRYSYSKLRKNIFLELGFKAKIHYKQDLHTLYENLDLRNNVLLYNIVTQKEYQYYNLLKKDSNKNSIKYALNKKTDNAIINTSRSKQNMLVKKDNIITVYMPIVDNHELNIFRNQDIVMKFKIDISPYMEFSDTLRNIFYIFILIVFIFMLFLFFWIKNFFTEPIGKIVKSIHTSKPIIDTKLLNNSDEIGIIANEYNKLFYSLQSEIINNKMMLLNNKCIISEIVHEIRTPLTVIMANASLIEMGRVYNKTCIIQINCAINMLTNSYEDLSYIISNDTIEYKKIDINISSFLKDRIEFFEQISKVNKKLIVPQIEQNISMSMNDIELERLFDNNIANAIKHSQKKSEIKITLNELNKKIILEFSSFGKVIEDTNSVFDKNYRESSSEKSMGLGLNIVKTICEKNNIEYKITREEGRNIFTYTFVES